jgi:aspartate/methionine/tyrosine aminotransferase
LNLSHADVERYPPPDWALPTIAEAVRNGAEVYTPSRGSADVRTQVAEQLSFLLRIEVDPERHLVLTPGTQSGLFTTFASLVDQGDVVALPDPDYMDTERMLRFCSGQVTHIPMRRGGAGGRWSLDLDALADRARDGACLLALSHPNNPTGAVLTESETQRIAEIACQYDLLVVVDELYARLVYDEQPFHHLVSQPGMRERTVTLVGPSKTEQLSGFRLGCVVAPATVIERIEQVLEISAVRAPAYAQPMLVPWLRDTSFVRSRVEEYQRLRDTAYLALDAVECVDVACPPGTSYIFPSVRALGRSDLEVARLLLEQAEVVVTPGGYFGPQGAGSFRICFAQDKGALERALERLAATLSSMAEGCL